MAKPIQLGLELEGQDAIDFWEYINDTTKKPNEATIECVKMAMRIKDGKIV